MTESSNKKRTVAIISLLFVFLIASIIYYEHLIYTDETQTSSAVYRLIPAEKKMKFLNIGQPAYYLEGALTCRHLESIKKYFDYMNYRGIRRAVGIPGLFIRGLCRYSAQAREDVIVSDIAGMFIEVKPASSNESRPMWIVETELVEQAR